MTSRHLSLYERCARLPTLLQLEDSPPEPIRDATRRFFELGLHQIFTGLDVTTPIDFLSAAAHGFLYPPNSDPYTLAQDYACWIDGALRLVEELGLRAWVAEPLQLSPDTALTLSGAWRTHSALHLFLIGDSLNSWPVWTAQLAHHSIHVYSFTLPSVRDGRLRSPLTTCYKHPTLNLLRLATLDTERGFSPKWSKIARWEDSTFTWPEWREGINRDRCLNKIVTHVELEGVEDDELRQDALAIINSSSTPAPRLREACTNCQFKGVCHDDIA